MRLFGPRLKYIPGISFNISFLIHPERILFSLIGSPRAIYAVIPYQYRGTNTPIKKRTLDSCSAGPKTPRPTLCKLILALQTEVRIFTRILPRILTRIRIYANPLANAHYPTWYQPPKVHTLHFLYNYIIYIPGISRGYPGDIPGLSLGYISILDEKDALIHDFRSLGCSSSCFMVLRVI